LDSGSTRAHRREIRMSVTDAAAISTAAPRAAAQTPFRRFVADFTESRLATIAFILLVVTMLLALIAPWIVPQDPYDLAQVDILDSRLTPGTPSSSGKYTHWLGTDGAGRDLVSAMLYGLRISLAVGVMSGLIA